jgi:hypothetical protein
MNLAKCIKGCEVLFKGVGKDPCPGLGNWDTREFWVLQGADQQYCILTVDIHRTGPKDPHPSYNPITTFCSGTGIGSWTDLCHGMYWYPTTGKLKVAIQEMSTSDVEMDSWGITTRWIMKEYA